APSGDSPCVPGGCKAAPCCVLGCFSLARNARPSPDEALMSVLPLVVCGAAATLYALGRRGRARVWREVSFYSGVAAAFVVLEPPFDGWADKWLAAHMSQHIVLMTV